MHFHILEMYHYMQTTTEKSVIKVDYFKKYMYPIYYDAIVCKGRTNCGMQQEL